MLVRSLRPFGFAFSLLAVAGDTWVLVYSAIGRLVHTCIFSGLINPHTCNGMGPLGPFQCLPPDSSFIFLLDDSPYSLYARGTGTGRCRDLYYDVNTLKQCLP